ncbi:MAG: BrnT family toxin [bacterium]|nr:BrnT family toxin [bacterium]
MVVFSDPIEFVWDKGNIDKNFIKHGVLSQESEEPFFDENRKIFTDKVHFSGEERFRMIGKTKSGRLLFVVFTIRNKKIRIISARDINRKEVYLYEEKTDVA